MTIQTRSTNWRLNRAGLINFWYYDHQEFKFSDGRMLLRGSNGSGKSVTMQSFIPLLLDGNRSPERLDPFGSKSRKLDNYMLDEQDTQDERVGYLYLEFKQTGVDLFQTIGMGIRARKHMPLDTWYFQLNTNKRINDNFSLYRNQKQTNVLTKSELRQAIGTDGQVFETQREYVETVNQLLFGFESVEEYKELINLLIQLRSPKLSKDFRPTVISEILTQSLQPLSDDDLRPLSESIENMDGIETNLAALKLVQTALTRLTQAFVHYNSAVFRTETLSLQTEASNLIEQLSRLASRSQLIESSQKELSDFRQQLQALESEQQVLEKQIEGLQHHDVVALKDRHERLVQEITSEKNYQTLKQSQIAKKDDELVRLNYALRDNQQAYSALKHQLNQTLTEMDELASELSFDEHTFFKQELLAQLETHFKFGLTDDALKKFKLLLHQATDALHKTESYQLAYDRLLQDQDRLVATRSQLERSEKEYQKQVMEIKAEWQTDFMQWSQSNRVLLLDANTQESLYHLVQQAENAYTAFPLIQNRLHQVKSDISQKLSAEVLKLTHEIAQKSDVIQAIETDYHIWLNQKDPEPLRSEASQTNRRRLREQAIPFVPFYQLLDFQADLSTKQINHLEELLLESKLLDALVVPAKYKQAVLTFEAGQQDTYLFIDYPGQLNLLTRYLVAVASGEQLEGWDKDALQSHLDSMLHENSMTQGDQLAPNLALDPLLGQFKLGPLVGTISGQYEAKFIGVSRRARYRLERLAQFELELAGLRQEEAQLNHRLLDTQQDLKQLDIESEQFPDFEDLRVAFQDLDSLLLQIKANQMSLNDLEKSVTRAKQDYEKTKSLSQQLCRKLNVSESIQEIKEMVSLSEEYTTQFSRLKHEQQQYVSSIEQKERLEDTLHNAELDLSDFIGEISRFEQRIAELDQDLSAVRQQLEASAYGEIRQLLDDALSRRQALPSEVNAMYGHISRLDQQLINYHEELKDLERQVDQHNTNLNRVYRAYQDELSLAYVYDNPEIHAIFQETLDGLWQQYLAAIQSEDLEQKNEALAGLLKCLTIELESLSSSSRYKVHEIAVEESLRRLQHEYIQQQNQLVNYSIQMKTYTGQKAFEYTREDIQTRLQGKHVSLFELNDYIAKQVEVNQHLLQKEDRELFEEIITNTIGRKIRARIYLSEEWVKEMNALMSHAEKATSNGFVLSLKWKYKESQQEGELSSRELIHLLKRDSALMTDADRDKLTLHFRNKIKQAREQLAESNHTFTFHTMLREVLDYRQWFEFQLLFKKAGEKMVELTNNKFFALSGGEKAMAMYVPLFSAVVAKYRGARPDAPRIISLDEAFAGIDELNIREMFRYMIEFNFNFIINSQILWGDYDTIPRMRIYQLLRPQNAKFVTVVPYLWDGSKRITEIEASELGQLESDND